jgi:peroxiredoxin
MATNDRGRRGAPAGCRPAPDFTLTALDGRSVSLASLRGRAVLLVFWFPT